MHTRIHRFFSRNSLFQQILLDLSNKDTIFIVYWLLEGTQTNLKKQIYTRLPLLYIILYSCTYN